MRFLDVPPSLLLLLVAAPAVQVLTAAGGVPEPGERLVEQGTPVELVALVTLPGRGAFAEAIEVRPARGGKVLRPRRPQPTWRVRWSKLEVADHSLSNTDPEFHWHEIAYRAVPIPACDGRWRCAADVHATLLGDRGGLGTMAFQVEVETDAGSAASPGIEARFRGGLSAEVARVTVRRDSTYLGYLTELFNTPYIWGSAGDPGMHQADRRIGSDCADFVTYGVRRMGHDVPYTSALALPRYARTLARSEGPDARGVYRDASGSPIPFPRPGDLVLFTRHVGALVADAPPLGVLSTSDVMIHTSWSEPIEQPIADSDYARQPIALLRWSVFERAPSN